MKTPDEIKKGLECCVIGPSAHYPKCGECPYMYESMCSDTFLKDALAYIQRLEAERDAAVRELVGTCQVCRWEDTEKCADCHFNPEAWNAHESNWEWRGVQKEE